MALAQQLERVRRRLGEAGIEARETSAAEIEIRAVHKKVGNVTIRLEDRELTISIGRHFHQHFPDDGGSQAASDSLVQFVADFVSGRSVLTVRSVGSRSITASVENSPTGELSTIIFPAPKLGFLGRILAPFASRRKATRSFRWSGPLSRRDAHAAQHESDVSRLAGRLALLTPDQMKQLSDYLQQRWGQSQDRRK